MSDIRRALVGKDWSCERPDTAVAGGWSHRFNEHANSNKPYPESSNKACPESTHKGVN